MKLVLAVAAIFFARFATTGWFYRSQDADLGWQRWLGDRILRDGRIPLRLGHETFTAQGAAWVPQEWLLSTGVALAEHLHRFGLLAIVMALFAAGAIAVTGLSARRLGASPFAASVCASFTGIAMLQSFGVRAQIMAWLTLAAFLFVLRTKNGPKRWFIVPIVALWANLHASAMLAVVLLAAWTIGRAMDGESWAPSLRRDLMLTLASAAALCATPLGWRLPGYAVELFWSPIVRHISEWQPATFGLDQPALLWGFLPLLASALALQMWQRDLPAREKLLLLAGVYLAIHAVRNIPVGALIIAPVVAARLTRVIPAGSRVNTLLRERGPLALVYFAAAAALVLVPLRLLETPAVSQTKLPFKALAALASMGGPRNVYCEDFAWCSLALGYPQLRVYLDGRCDPFPLAVWNDYNATVAARPGWQRSAAQRGVDAMLVMNGRPLAKALDKQHVSWHLAYRDHRYSIFVYDRRTGAVNKRGTPGEAKGTML